MPGFRKKSRRNRSNRRNIKKRQSRRNRTNGGRRYRHRGGNEDDTNAAAATQTVFNPEVVKSEVTINMGGKKYEVTTDENGNMNVTVPDAAPADEGGVEANLEESSKSNENEGTANANTNDAGRDAANAVTDSKAD